MMQSFIFKDEVNSNDKERYIFEKEEIDKKNMEEIRNILLNINENDISKENSGTKINVKDNNK